MHRSHLCIVGTCFTSFCRSQIQGDLVIFQASPGLSCLSSLRLERRTRDATRLLSLEVCKRERHKIENWKNDQVNGRLAQMTIQFFLQVQSMQCRVSVFHIISVRWSGAFTMRGISWCEMEAELLASIPSALVFFKVAHSRCQGRLPVKKGPSPNRRNQRIDAC